jgi:hypothetical protein
MANRHVSILQVVRQIESHVRFSCRPFPAARYRRSDRADHRHRRRESTTPACETNPEGTFEK